MWRVKSRFVILIFAVLAVSAVNAVPAYRGPMTHVQSDGSTVTVYQHGDEFFSYVTNEAGQWLQADEKGDYRIVPALNEKEIALQRAESSLNRRMRRATNMTGVDRLLSPRGPVILVNYQDISWQSTREQMDEWANGENYNYKGATGSVRQYFHDVSNGQYDLQIDVFGPVTLSNNAAYYGGDLDANNKDTCAQDVIVEACQLAAQQCGADFSQYDSDEDGCVDWVVILYAGLGQADGGETWTIWPHQWDLANAGMAFELDGKTINHYCMLNEINGQSGDRAGIGTFVHEFSHVMGLPDLYETTGQGLWKTCGEWDVMDYGPYNNDGNTPPAYSAYERWFMGWMTPTLLSKAMTVSLVELNSGQAAGLITTTGAHNLNVFNPTPTTFYLVENRQKEGWDAYLPGHGMLLTKINYSRMKWMYNAVNNTESKLGVDLIEADGKAPYDSARNRNNGWFGKAGDAFPAGATSYEGITNFKITNVIERNKVVSFNLRGGGEAVVLDINKVSAPAETSVKWLRNGHIIIQRGEELYDINGKRIY